MVQASYQLHAPTPSVLVNVRGLMFLFLLVALRYYSQKTFVANALFKSPSNQKYGFFFTVFE